MERAELKVLLRGTGCAEERGGFVFLHDPAHSSVVPALASVSAENGGWLCVRTGGSSGAVKFARHDEQTLTAAVRGFCGHFSMSRVNAIDVLPPYHVSGLMARVRCAATGGQHLPWSWKRLEAGEVPALAPGDWVLSLVPTQLQRLLQSPAMVTWLRSLQVIFIGGGPAWPTLLDAAAEARLPLALSYGMTETAAMVTALRPEEFLAGDRSSGSPLPHAQLALSGEGLISITGESVFRGYFPDWRSSREFTTEDLGRVDQRGQLHVLGRRDAVIITGGKKVNPADVEAALRASGEFADVAVVGVPDPEWGEAVVACYPEPVRTPDLGTAVSRLAPYERPKSFVRIAGPEWPRNEQGKVNRAALKAIVSREIAH